MPRSALAFPIAHRLLLPAAVMAAGLLSAGCPTGRKNLAPPVASNLPASAAVNGIRFEDVARRAGITFRWPALPRPTRNLEAFGDGCAFLDYDGDGWQDVLLVAKPHAALYRNLRDGRFDDVTAVSGLDRIEGDWKGCAVGDYDGDGRQDLVLTGYRRLALLHNEGGTQFRDRTSESGLDPHNHNHWGSSAGFMDLRNTGQLDLVILNYVVFGPSTPQFCELSPGVVSGCPPARYNPEYGELWMNLGNGKFKDAAAVSGMKSTGGKALVVGFVDLDGQGRMDFYIGNDGMPADLMHNKGDLRFENIGQRSGVAYLTGSQTMAAMCADWGDYDRDGRMDLIVTNFSDTAYAVFHNLGGRMFVNAGDELGISGPTMKPLGFGGKWIDVDNDGWLDIVFANGHVYDNVERSDPLSTFRQPLMLFHNESGRSFSDLIPKMGGEVAQPILGRGSATGDYDNDGRMDMLVVDYEGGPMLLHNVSTTNDHWLKLDLRGAAANRFAYGAQVTARASKTTWTGQASPASSYLSSSDPRVHFGLGTVTTVDSVTIRWPDGKKDTLNRMASDHAYVVTEGKGITGESPRSLH